MLTFLLVSGVGCGDGVGNGRGCVTSGSASGFGVDFEYRVHMLPAVEL